MKNLGLYNQDLSIPRKKDVDAKNESSVEIVVDSVQPTNQKIGDFWYEET